jgi:hypothetical protein
MGKQLKKKRKGKKKLSKEEQALIQASQYRKKAPRRKVEAKVSIFKEAFQGKGSQFKLFGE